MQNLANGIVMSRILDLERPCYIANDVDQSEELYKKRLARLRQMDSGSRLQKLLAEQVADRSRYVEGQGRVGENLSVPAQTYTSFVPFITSIGRQCLPPSAQNIKLVILLFFVCICCLCNNKAFSRSYGDFCAVSGGVKSAVCMGVVDTTYTIVGSVQALYSPAKIEGARISVKGSTDQAFTDSEGRFALSTVIRDGYIIIEKAGYRALDVSFTDGAIDVARSVFYMEKDPNQIPALQIGDTLPNLLLDLPLSVVNHPQHRAEVSLREYMDADLIVLDFWAKWCSPCVASVEKWENIVRRVGDRIKVLTVHVDIADRALPFIEKRNWKLPCVVGENVPLLNAFFFNRKQVGCVVFLYQGKLFAIPRDKGHNLEKLKKFLDGDTAIDFVSMEEYTHREGKGGIQ